MTDRFLITMAPGHLKMQMQTLWMERLSAQLKADATGGEALHDALLLRLKRIDSEFEVLQPKLIDWASSHGIDIEWRDSPGRRTYKRNYRVVMEPPGRNPEEVFDALDAEIRRLILEEPSPQ